MKADFRVPGALGRFAQLRGHWAYYLGRETIIPTRTVLGMALWREEIFAILNRNAARSAAYFCVPARQVVEIGIEIEI